MDDCRQLLQLFLEYTNRSEELVRRASRQALAGYDNSELNCLDWIGRLKDPNVTAIAEAMRMTRGAVSKITRKLLEKGAVTAYRLGDNRQKVFFRLTEAGGELFREHARRHAAWADRDLGFFRSLPPELCGQAADFMRRYNAFLLQCLEEGDREEDSQADK